MGVIDDATQEAVEEMRTLARAYGVALEQRNVAEETLNDATDRVYSLSNRLRDARNVVVNLLEED